MMRWSLSSWALVLVAGCGGPQQQNREAVDPSTADKLDEKWSPDEESWAPGETSDWSRKPERVDIRDLKSSETGAGDSGGSRPPPSEAYEMTFNDCQVLANHYYKVIVAEERGKIGDGLKGQQRAAAEASADKSAQKGKDQWLEQCSGLVGSAYQREWLTCAMAATTVDGFTKCITGSK